MNTWWPTFWGSSAPEPVVDEPMVMNEPYKHKRLERPTTIRLIRIMRKKINGHVACTIFQTDREKVPITKYQALSYLWGNQKPTRRIYLRDNNEGWRPFALHQNLWEFLHHAWRNEMFGTPFWTDRLCLDQSDHDEVAQQVLLMGEIYSKANRVVVWLNISPYDLEIILKALEWNKPLGRDINLLRDERLRLIGNYQARRNLDMMAYHTTSPFLNTTSRDVGLASQLYLSMLRERSGTFQTQTDREETFTRALRRLSLNNYWLRVWIVQEVVKANEVEVMTEKFSLDLDSLLRPFIEFREDDIREYSAMWKIWDMRRSNGVHPLWRLLREFPNRESSRPADLVYGFLGMVADPDDGSSSVKNISIDYAKPAAHVLLDATFESSPPLRQYGDKPHFLLRHRLKNYDSLEEYIRSIRTSQRHSGFASLTRHVWKSVEAMIAVISYVGEANLRQAALELFRDDNWEPTLHQNGAIMGLVFASYVYGHSSHLDQQSSRNRLEVSSPWRCAVHMHRTAHQEQRKRTIARVADLQGKWHSWDTRLAATVCAEKSESCDFSTMVFDIPDLGFRLLLETDMNGCLEARWRLQLDKKTKGVVMANFQRQD